MATAPIKTANEWLKVLSSAGKRVADEVPEGYKTVAQIAKETGKSSSQTTKHLREALKLGLVETRRFTIETGDKLYPVPHIELDPRQKSKDRLDSTIHEVAHCIWPEYPEEIIVKIAQRMASVLWADGWRRIHK